MPANRSDRVAPAAKPLSSVISADTIVLTHDYAEIDEKYRLRLQEIAVTIKGRLKRAAADVFVIGRALIEVQEYLDHGQWLRWLDGEFGMTARTAYNFMSVARRLGGKSEYFKNVPPTALYLLASKSTPDAAVTYVEALVETGEPVNVPTVKDIIRKVKNQHVKHRHEDNEGRTNQPQEITPSGLSVEGQPGDDAVHLERAYMAIVQAISHIEDYRSVSDDDRADALRLVADLLEAVGRSIGRDLT